MDSYGANKYKRSGRSSNILLYKKNAKKNNFASALDNFKLSSQQDHYWDQNKSELKYAEERGHLYFILGGVGVGGLGCHRTPLLTRGQAWVCAGRPSNSNTIFRVTETPCHCSWPVLGQDSVYLQMKRCISVARVCSIVFIFSY